MSSLFDPPEMSPAMFISVTRVVIPAWLCPMAFVKFPQNKDKLGTASHYKTWKLKTKGQPMYHDSSIYISIFKLYFCLQTQEAKKIIRNFNKMAAVLLEYEVRYQQSYFPNKK